MLLLLVVFLALQPFSPGDERGREGCPPVAVQEPDKKLGQNPISEESNTAPAGYLPTQQFSILLSKIDFSDETKINLFQENLRLHKGLLSFPEYCYLQGRIDFVKGDFPDVVRLFRQIIDIDDFTQRYSDSFYYLGIGYAKGKNLREAERYLREFQRRASEEDPLFSKSKEAIRNLTAHDVDASSNEPKKEPSPHSESTPHVFIAEQKPTAVNSPHSRLPTNDSHANHSQESLSVRLGSDDFMLDGLGEKPLLLHFWASWCAPCAQELPSLVTFTKSKRFRKENQIKPIFITVDNSAGEGQYFLEHKSLDLPALYWDQDMAVLKRLTGKNLIPSTVLYDAKAHHVIKVYPQLNWGSKKVQDDIHTAVDLYLKSRSGRRKESVH